MLKLRLLACAGVLALSATAMAQQAARAPSPGEEPRTYRLSVPAPQPWAVMDGVSVKAGEQLRICAEPADQRWSAFSSEETQYARRLQVDPSTGPNGYGDTAGTRGLAWPGANRGALIGKIGEGGEPFFVGVCYDRPAHADGQLYLSMNDILGQHSDNQGGIIVAISVTPVPPPPQEEIRQEPAPQEPAPQAPPVDLPEVEGPLLNEADVVRPPAPPPTEIVSTEVVREFDWVRAALIGAGALLGMGLLVRLLRPRSAPRESRAREGTPPRVAARISSDGLAGQSLTITVGRRS